MIGSFTFACVLYQGHPLLLNIVLTIHDGNGIEKLIQSGVSAVIQPRGSIRDKEIIKFADKTNTILIFSKTRHFRH